MKNLFKITVALAFATCFFSCHRDLVIPDPGFDMSETVLDTLRRDTSSVYPISFTVKAPNGVRSIKLLNGRNYETIQEFDEYVNKTNFTFSHKFDFSKIDSEKDSLFVYNIKILTNDNRGYNKSIRVQQLRKSHPQIVGPSDNMNVFGRVFVFDGNIDTGFYTIDKIVISVNDKQVKSIKKEELGLVTNYRLYHPLTYDFEVGKEYVYKVSVTASNGEEKSFSYKLRSMNLKKPVAIKYFNWNAYKSSIIHYNDKGLVEALFDPANSYFYALHYDAEGRLTTVLRCYNTYIANATDALGLYGHGTGTWYTYNEDGSLKRYADFTYVAQVGDKIHKLLDPFWNRTDLIPASCLLADLAGTDREGFITKIEVGNDESKNVYITDSFGKRYISKMHGTNSNDIGPFKYIDDFEEGRLICTSVPNAIKNGVQAFAVAEADWAQISGVAPVLNPLYIKDFPTPMQFKACGAFSIAVFATKYVMTSISNVYASGGYKGTYPVPYIVRDDGVLKSFCTLDYPIQTSVAARKIFYYYYDDESDDNWRPNLVANTEDKINNYMK